MYAVLIDAIDSIRDWLIAPASNDFVLLVTAFFFIARGGGLRKSRI